MIEAIHRTEPNRGRPVGGPVANSGEFGKDLAAAVNAAPQIPTPDPVAISAVEPQVDEVGEPILVLTDPVDDGGGIGSCWTPEAPVVGPDTGPEPGSVVTVTPVTTAVGPGIPVPGPAVDDSLAPPEPEPSVPAGPMAALSALPDAAPMVDGPVTDGRSMAMAVDDPSADQESGPAPVDGDRDRDVALAVALTGAVSPSAAASVAPPETTGAGATEPANQAVLTAIGIGTIPPVEVSHDGPDAEAGDADTMGSDSADITSFDPKSVRPAATADAVPVTAATIDRTGVVTASPGAAPTVSASVLRSEHVRVLRELAPNREVQRLAVDLDGARVALRFDSDGARVHVVSDPGNQLGGTWASDVQRTLNSGARQQAGFQHRDPDGGRRQRQPYESASAFDERRALDFAARLESAEGV